MNTEEKKALYRAVRKAFYAVGDVLYPVVETHRRVMPQQLLDACESAMAGLSIHMARLEAEIGTDNL